MTERLRRALFAPTDVLGLVAFRVFFGALVAVSALRFLAYGWVDLFFVRPTFHFHYLGFEWVQPLGRAGMHGVFVALVVLGACVAAGFATRLACLAIFVGLTYVQLLDVATYLNHYVLVSLLALLLATMPIGRAWSIDAWRRPAARLEAFPAWCTWLLRFQVGVVYTFAGLAKVSEDWLLHAQPLSIWLASRTHLPLVGPWLDEPVAALLVSWAGCLFDTTIVLWLLWSRTRAVAYLVVLGFHAATSLLFPIGMFPVIMVVGATAFFDPAWPRRLAKRLGGRFASAPVPGDVDDVPAPSARQRVGMVALASFAALQLLLPLRAHAYGGNVLWHEQGMRFSWRVMVREKNASVTYRVTDPATGVTKEVPPRAYLARWQEREFGTQPDLVLQLGRRIAADEGARRGRPVEVRVDAVASLNGRRRARLVDPEVDLAVLEDSLAPAPWILPEPSGDPPVRVASR
jgi:vitamin K-dependent gamma-carboxylase